MICERCGEKATVHITRVENGVRQERHLCEKCTRETMGLSFKGPITANNALAGILELMKDPGGIPEVFEDKICPGCGMTFGDFKESGRMGCPACYETFRDRMRPLVKKIHRSEAHTGKMPNRTGSGFALDRQINECRQNMKEAVLSENFEKAALLRDEIKALEKKRV